MIENNNKSCLWLYLTIPILLMFFIALPAFSGEFTPDDETCMGCHDGYDLSLEVTPHRLSSTIEKPSISIGCVSCHGDGTAHVEDPSTENIINPVNLKDGKQLDACSGCHTGHNELDNYGFDPHQTSDLNCSSCHKVHSNNPGALLDTKADFCGKCHTETTTRFIRRSNHPTLSNNVTCLSCHQFAKRLDDPMAFDINQICQDCHTEQAGPHLFEHEATNAFSVEGDGCIGCHEPHGSENDRLLRMPANQLCQQCHAVPGHKIAHASQYEDYDCRDCHTQVHGSNNNQQFLDPALPARIGINCYQSGCHSLSN